MSEGLRKRGSLSSSASASAPSSSSSSSSSSSKRIAKVVKALDVYSNSKVAREFTEASDRAKQLSRFGYAVMGVLLVSEVRAYLRVEERDHMVVDTTLGERLNITLNVSFPALKCSQVHLDAMDVAGDYHPYMEQHVRKRRWREGRIIEEPEETNVECGSCFGAETTTLKCCDTCESLTRAYAAKGWSTGDVKRNAPQCAQHNEAKGCNLAGWLEVNKVGGNFHVALGESTVRDNRFIHQFNPTDAPAFNVSHVIHDLSFGDPYPGMALPLRGMVKNCRESTGLYQYFIKLVPTLYTSSPSAAPFRTTRYSFTHRFRPLQQQQEAVEHRDHHAHARAHAPTALLPGVFWVYDLSAFMVQVTRHRPTLTHLIVRVCAIVGGVTTILGAVARLLGL
ncbi:hypothetical protein CTAYLR_008793 [Chrysophaeum taylorii]|uniref:Endoplasmic reticulum-Golgi intermediate compartment protein 3 n=1 Tax=Chrysophaeum taylorii TaxID=2483200 RepID=A0AAD7UR13_9STRA|nr:hypothetical protein CTAYLR_008793 [Chrysophaeum taylorii]